MSTNPKTVDAYNVGAKEYNDHVSVASASPYHSYYEKPAIRALLPNLENLSVISIGCGSGVDARYLKDAGATRVVGIDISSGLIEVAKKNHPNIEFHVMDMEKLDFPDASFDLAYSSLAIHYVTNWVTPLKEAYRILKSGGLYVFSCGHPIGSAMEIFDEGNIRGRRLGKTIAKDTNTRTIHGDYLAISDNGIKPMTGKIGEMEIHFYHRPISKMISEIVEAGFKIEKMIEPVPLEEMKILHEKDYLKLIKYPEFMIWVLKRE